MKLKIERTAEDDAAGPVLDLDKAIKEFFQEFPDRRRDTFILNHQKFSSGKEAVDSLAGDLKDFQASFPAVKTMLSKSIALGAFEAKMPMSVNLAESSFNNKPDIEIFGRIVIPAGDQFTARVVKSIFVSNDTIPNTSFPVMTDAFNNTEMWQRYVLDHELGHALTMIGINKLEQKDISISNRAECEADAYAMIRHFQRYGADSEFPAYIRDVRNMNVVHKCDVTHWTSSAIDKVIALNAADKLKDLTPQQSRDLAVSIAKTCAISADADTNLEEGFADLQAIMRKVSKKAPLTRETLMDVIKGTGVVGVETSSPAALDVCQRYLKQVAAYVPGGMLSDEDLQAVSEAYDAVKDRTLKEEPSVKGLSRIFRDALLDAQTGVRKDTPKPAKKPPEPKP